MQKGVSHKNMACVFFCLDKKENWQKKRKICRKNVAKSRKSSEKASEKSL